MMGLEAIFNPRSVAVIGASADERKLGHIILRNILDGGFKGEVYPVNPKRGKILGLKVYKSIGKIPEDVDLTVYVIPARFIPDPVREAADKGVKGIVVISGGFRESGEGGRALEEGLVGVVREGRIRMVEPNCQGVNNPHIGLCASWPLIKTTGCVAVVSQSGTVGAFMEIMLEEDGVELSKLVALGNKADVDEIDMLRYLATDEETEVVALYLEGTGDGRKFMDALKECIAKKPVVILKSGRTEGGAKAVSNHTGALAGSSRVFEAALKRCEAISVESLKEFYDTAKLLSYYRLLRNNRIFIVTSSEGAGILAADMLQEAGLKQAVLSDESVERLRQVLPPYCIIGNPLDLTGSAVAEQYKMVVEATIKDGYGMYIFIFGDPVPGAAEITKDVIDRYGRIVILVFLGGGDVQAMEVEKFRKYGIPVFPTPERAIRALSHLASLQRES